MEVTSLVSVIVPCYNHSQYLPEALQSILDQTYSKWECIIVDDGSLDDTENVANEWLLKDNRFRYLKKENGGLSSARNYGIKNSNGKYILTLDADDEYKSSFLSKALYVLSNEKNIGIVSSWGIRFRKDNYFDEFKPIGKSIKDFLFSNAVTGTSLFRKECWEQVGGYDENMKLGYEDWEFYIRICRLGWKVHVIQEILFLYRQHEISMRTIAVDKHDREIRNYIFLKHRELYIENFDSFTNYLLSRIEKEKTRQIEITKRLEYRIGVIILRPLRWIKSFFKY
jgi:hypothetical protein